MGAERTLKVNVFLFYRDAAPSGARQRARKLGKANFTLKNRTHSRQKQISPNAPLKARVKLRA